MQRTAQRIGLAQINSSSDALVSNREKHFEMIDQAKEQGADLLVFPELSLHGHCSGSMAPDIGLTDESDVIAQLANHSKAITCLVGGIESSSSGLFYNTTYAIRDGVILEKHRKLNIPTYGNLEEGKYFAPGKKHTVFDLGVSGFKAGILTCADSWNPALVYTLALTGCQLILQPVSSALNAVSGNYNNPRGWQTNLSHTAMTWGTFVVMVNRVGMDHDLTFYGNSSVIDPYGNSLIKLDSEEQLAIVDIDLEEIKKARFNLPTLRDAQLDLVSRHLKQFT